MTFHTRNLEGTHLELKSEADGLGEPAGDVAEAVATALDGIRTDLGARLSALEVKAADTAKRLSRPAVIAEPAEAPEAIERKAFDSYLRRGLDRMQPDEVKALNVATGSQGGFLAPPSFGDELLKKIIEHSPIRKYARVIKIGAPSITYPRRVGGVAAFWVSETGARTGSEPSYEQVTITPGELGTFVDATTQSLEDNVYDLDGELHDQFARFFGKFEGAAFINGTGLGQPKGLLTATGIAEVKTGVAANFPSTNPIDVINNLFHAIPTLVSENAVWLMNRNTLRTVRGWRDAQGRFLVNDPISGPGFTLFGRPIVEAPDMPDVAANATPIMFGDLSGYRIVDRVELETLRDPYSLAAVGQVRIHARKRVGGEVTHPDLFVKLRVAA